MSALNSVGNVVISSISGINLSNLKIQDLATCTQPADLANKLYVDSRLGRVTNIGTGIPLLRGDPPATNILVRSLVGNGYTTANDNTQVYLNYDLYNFSFPENVLATTINVPNLTDKFVGGVLAKDGKIYCVPSSYTAVLTIDTYTGSGGGNLDYSITGAGIVGNGGWYGGVLAPNGKIYCVPYNATNVLIIDPITKTADTTSLSGLGSTTSKWIGGVLAPNGKIYCVPYSSSSVLIIDPVNSTLDTSTISGFTGTNKWRGGVLAPNGSIYCGPADITNMLIINTLTNIPSTTTITGFPSTTNKWGCGCLAPNNGNLYFVPNTETRVLIINPTGNTVNTTSITRNFQGTKWFGCCVGANGDIYCAPQATTQLLIIDPINTTSILTVIGGFPTNGSAFAGANFAPNGNVYLIPDDITYVGVVNSGLLTVQLLQALSAYYNKL